eukprot:1158631-Pelagomonas_calceolata.AAC.3
MGADGNVARVSTPVVQNWCVNWLRRSLVPSPGGTGLLGGLGQKDGHPVCTVQILTCPEGPFSIVVYHPCAGAMLIYSGHPVCTMVAKRHSIANKTLIEGGSKSPLGACLHGRRQRISYCFTEPADSEHSTNRTLQHILPCVVPVERKKKKKAYACQVWPRALRKGPSKESIKEGFPVDNFSAEQ